MFSNNSGKFSSRILRYFISKSFYLLYHQFAWTYDFIADLVSIGRWKSWIFSVLPYISDGVVLELGCGPGHLQLAFARKEINSIGIDASKYMVKIAHKRLKKHSLSANIVHGSSINLPFPDHSFKNIVATFPSEYINSRETLQQAWRVLNIPGELIILPVAWITGNRWYERAAAWIFRLTGQAPLLDKVVQSDLPLFPLSTLEEIGFQIRTEFIEHESSEIFLIHAEKRFTN